MASHDGCRTHGDDIAPSGGVGPRGGFQPPGDDIAPSGGVGPRGDAGLNGGVASRDGIVRAWSELGQSLDNVRGLLLISPCAW